jgi:ribonuclease HII
MMVSMLWTGIDEAGRGSLIGPLVVCSFTIEEEKIEELENLKVKDSKKLSPKKREELYQKLSKIGNFSFDIIDAEKINRSTLSLNKLEILSFIKLSDGDIVIIDCPEQNEARFVEKIRKSIPKELIVENKADENYLVVSAASIGAKVMRDLKIKELEKRLKMEIGSGYPGDRRTLDFVKKIIKNKEIVDKIVRKRWSTFEKITQINHQQELVEKKQINRI